MLRVQEKNEKREEMVVTIEKSVGAQSNKNAAAVTSIKAKHLKNRKYALLKRLMLFGLSPSLRMAALKMLMCKKRKLALYDLDNDDVEEGNNNLNTSTNKV